MPLAVCKTAFLELKFLFYIKNNTQTTLSLFKGTKKAPSTEVERAKA
jgi:hypothetical protein